MSKSTRNRTALIAFVAAVSMACRTPSPLTQLLKARDVSADLILQFVTATDASNKAIMADTDELSASFVRDAEGAKQAVQADIKTLEQLLADLGYAPERDRLKQFVSQFERYRELDRQILALAAENSNRKAQRLSFAQAQQEADSFRDAVDSLRPAGGNQWQVRAIAATAVAAVREIQVLEAPHIAEAGDAGMAAMEKRMATSETAARSALQALTPLVSAPSQPDLTAANSAFERFMAVHAQITKLSRQNTNVRALALSLNEKGRLTVESENALTALREALAKRGSAATR